MLANLFLIILYTSFFTGVLYWFCKRRTTQLTFKQASAAFVAKVIFGCLYGWFFFHYYGGDDTWYYQAEALKELQLLKQNPSAFFRKDLFESGYTDNPLLTIFNSNDSFFKDLQQNLLIKLLAIFNLFSGGRYYVNVVLYNMLVFCGSYYFFALITRYYTAKKNLWLFIIFFFPPLVFWTSGIRKDGLCVVFIFGCLYHTALFIAGNKKLKHAAVSIVFFLCLFLIRGFLALSLIPVIAAWIIAARTRISRSVKIYFAVTGSFILLFFLTTFLPASYNLPQKIADRQLAFVQLKGGSALSLKQLEPTFFSFIKVLPQALTNTFLQPYPKQAFTGPLYLLAFIENIIVIGLFIAVLLKPASDWKTIIKQPFTLAMIFLALINYVAIGFLVPFIGAIIRYKIIFEALLIIVLLELSSFEPETVTKWFRKKKTVTTSEANEVLQVS